MADTTTIVRETSVEEAKNHFPEMLYKYRIWNEPYHNQILSNQEIFFSSPYSFVDDKDCRFPIDHSCSLEEFTERHKLNYKNMSGAKVMSDQQLASIAKFLYQEEWDSPEKLKIKEEQYHQMSNSALGIYCLCKTSDNVEMWSKYGGKLSGFCVGTDFKECFEKLAENFIGGGDVEYFSKDTPPLKYVSVTQLDRYEKYRFFFESFRRKYEDWRFEDEYRLVKFMQTDVLNPIPSDSDRRKFIVPKECIKEVIFGEQMDKQVIEDIIETCSQNDLHVDFKKAIYENNKVIIMPF